MTPAVPERLRHIEAEAGSPLAQLIEQGYCVSAARLRQRRSAA
jgi:hypothetical protein